jgi:hypothetical protein
MMKNTLWVGLGLLIGVGIGLALRVPLTKRAAAPFYQKQYVQKGDFALRDTESAISRAEF